jgi:hypothetical protein
MAIRKIISRSIGVDVIAAEDLAAGSVETAEIQNGAVTGPKLADNLNYDSGTLYLDSTNNRVAIGSTSSLEKLRVAGNIEVLNDDADGYIWFHDAGTRSWAVGSVQSTGKFSINYSSNFSSAERLTIDPNGFTSLNTTTGNERLNVAGAIGSSGASANFGAGDERIIMDYTGSVARIGHVNGASGSAKPLQFLIAGSERMRIDSSGNVGIGATPETTFAQKRTLRLSTTASLIAGNAYYPYPYYVANNLYYDSSDNLKYIASSGGALLDVNAHLGGRFTFYTAPTGTSGASASITERMRLTTEGHLCLNKTSDSFNDSVGISVNGAAGLIRIERNNDPSLQLNRMNANGEIVQFFRGAGNKVGNITGNTSSTSYNTSSDYRLKENVEYDFDASTRLKQLKPARFNFIADADNTVDGFLAHEVQSVVPEAITGTHDGMRDEEYEVTPAVEATYDDDGNILTEEVPAVMATRSVPDYQGIDQGKLVPLLVKSLQEALTEIDSLKARLDDAGL